jgi:hypothetical protein
MMNTDNARDTVWIGYAVVAVAPCVRRPFCTFSESTGSGIWQIDTVEQFEMLATSTTTFRDITFATHEAL